MCGVTGFIDFTNRLGKAELLKMNSVLAHRGPDAEGDFLKMYPGFTLGLAHRRLSIIDLSKSANQPMIEAEVVVVFNGEIYNFKEIKNELLALGHIFNTQSDTEVIIKSYRQWGLESVHRFIGMFAIVIWDERLDKLFFLRDRAGVKPLFYYWDGRMLLFSSELKSFMALDSFSKEMDQNIIAEFLTFGYINSKDSIFKGVKKVQPASIIEFNVSNKSINDYKYWSSEDFLTAKKLEIGYEDAKVQLALKLKEAIGYRLVSDVPVGVFLSGGYDSTLVTAYLQEQSASNINTFTVGVEDNNLNEAIYAKKIAEFLGTKHHEIVCTSNEMFSLIEKLPYYFDEPFGDSSALATMLVSSFARKKVKVALSADGGDELFAGYNRYDYLNILKLFQSFGPIGKLLIPILKSLSERNINYYRLYCLTRNPSAQVMGNLLNTVTHPSHISGLFVNGDVDFNPIRIYLKGKYNSNLSEFLSLDYSTYLTNDILTKVDRATMSVGLEGREPLLDHRLFEFVAVLPDKFKRSAKEKKAIVKDLVHQIIPIDLMARPKMGFAVPVRSWLNNELSGHLDYFLGEKYIVDQGIFEFQKVKAIRVSFQQGNLKNHELIWYFLMFQMWYHHWMK